MTGSGPLSAASFQPPPYWNGTSNIAKKSPVVTRVVHLRSARSARRSAAAAREHDADALYMITLCVGMSDCIRYVASR